MRVSDINLLQCLDCAGDLYLRQGTPDGHIIVQGILVCAQCGSWYPIVDEVGIFFKPALLSNYLSPRESEVIRSFGLSPSLPKTATDEEKRQLAVSQNWEFEWNIIHPFEKKDLTGNGFFGAEVFWNFIPLERYEIHNKIVFIGCGARGREAFHVAQENPSLIIINEIGSEIYSIKDLFSDSPVPILLLRGDLTSLPLKDHTVNVAICDHALQHIPDYQKAFSVLSRIVCSGGMTAICVYSLENNFLMTDIIEPLKQFFHFLPIRFQHLLGFVPALFFAVLIAGFYRPVHFLFPVMYKYLPLVEHFEMWGGCSLKFLWTACFDLIHAPVSHHFDEDEMKQLAASNLLRIELLKNTNQTLWSMICKK
ncbi:MAG: methyltransferase domain-containing protein [Candidatus Riflebacteria bacterium]|nr:methyltransferase domain-containing protein [Candidatus Riflebacteria bacterium]